MDGVGSGGRQTDFWQRQTSLLVFLEVPTGLREEEEGEEKTRRGMGGGCSSVDGENGERERSRPLLLIAAERAVDHARVGIF